MITIVDYGMGNLRSVQKAFEFVGYEAQITDKKSEILKADKIVLPGVGAFADAVKSLKTSGISNAISKKTSDGTPFLGICLGMQLLFDVSYEGGEYEGLGLIRGEVKKFALPPSFKVPHIGWNKLSVKSNPFFEGLRSDIYTYFVHSYYVDTDETDVVTATCSYGMDFTAAVNKGNIYAVQFHPEKSGTQGLQMLKNFAEIK